MNMTNLKNFVDKQEGKSFSHCLRIAADMIEEINEKSPDPDKPLIKQHPEQDYEIEVIFRKLCQYLSGIDLVEQSIYSQRKVKTTYKGKPIARKTK